MINRRRLLAAALALPALTPGVAGANAHPLIALWTVIDAARQASRGEAEEDRDQAIVDAVSKRLIAGGADLAVAFEAGFNEAMRRAYRWDLWGAGYVIHGGQSDDGFTYFRAWLIAQGRSVFDQALSDPDSLGDFVPEGREAALELEMLMYAAAGAWEEITGREPTGPQWQAYDGFGEEPIGVQFDENTNDQAYPRLTARFGKAPLG